MLANQLSAAGDDRVTVLSYYNSKLPNIYDISPKIEQRFFLQSYSSMSKQLLNGGVMRLRAFLKDNDVDVLIACGALFFPISVLACKKIKTKSVCWEHSDPEGNNDHRGQLLARRFGIKFSDLNVVLTRRAYKIYKEKFRAPNTVQIYNPIDPVALRSSGEYDSQSKRIISVGRLTYQKNFQVAVVVAAKVLPQFPDWQWDVYGQGEDYDELVNLANKAGIGEQMHFKGQVTDLYERYKQYGIMVMTSRYEGFPMTLLEGNGNGLPLVSFDVPTGPSEIIEDGVNGYLLQEGHVDEMADRLIHLMTDDSLRITMSRECRKMAGAFEIQDITKKWKETLHSIV